MTGTNPFSHSGVFSSISDELDPSLTRIAQARRRFEDWGGWIEEHAAGAARDVRVYPQGSFILGTTNQDPFTGEFDIDLVISIEYHKHEISQSSLNEMVNGWMDNYVASRMDAGGELAPTGLQRGKRAWTIEYHDSFHMDILPVVPDIGNELIAEGGDPSWLTDKALVQWQPTNPKGFVEHFGRVSAEERQVLETRAKVEIEALPPDARSKTTLQMAVKLIKRHRDHSFRNDEAAMAPPSALVTALATKAYEKATPAGGELAEVLTAIASMMPDLLDEEDGELVVSNPTCVAENYADRYEGNPARKEALHLWLGRLIADVGTVRTSKGPIELRESVSKAFGAGLGERVTERLGVNAANIRGAGNLHSTTAGALGMASTSGGQAHQPHTFFGGESG